MSIIITKNIMLIVNTNYIIIFIYYRVDIRRELLHNIDRRRQFIPIGYSEIAENSPVDFD